MTQGAASNLHRSRVFAWISRHPKGRAALGSVIVFALVMLAVLLAAFAWPASYSTTAVVAIEPPPGVQSNDLVLPSPDTTAVELRRALLVPAELSELARVMELKPSDPAVAEAIRVMPLASRAFLVMFSGADPEAVQRATNTLADRVVERAPRILELGPGLAAAVIRQRERELADFAEAHPEVALGAVSSAAPTARGSDATLNALRSERARLEKEIREQNALPPSDPYQPSAEERSKAERRLLEINTAIRARERAPSVEPTNNAGSSSTELRAKWRQLVDALSAARNEARAPAPSDAPRLVARVSSRAPLPAKPISPNRLLIIAVGLVAAAGLSALSFPVSAWMARRAGHGARTRSPSHAPSAAGATQNSSMPKADTLPPSEPPRQPTESSAPPAKNPSEPTLRRLSPQPPPGAGAYSMSTRRPSSPETVHGSPELALAPVGEVEVVPRRRRAPATLIGGTRLEAFAREDAEAAREFRVNVSESPGEVRAGQSAAGRADADAAPRVAPGENRALVRVSQSSGPTTTVTSYPVRSGWQPNPELSPADWLHPVRDELYRRALNRCFVVAVMALPDAEPLKSKVAAQLALALAETRQPRVLLLDADFDYPSVHRWLRVEMRPGTGFSQQMRSHIRDEMPGGFSVMQCSPSLFLLGEARIRSPGLLRTMEFENAVNLLRQHHELIVIDAPTVSLSTEFRALEAVADGVLLAASDHAQGENALRQLKPIFGSKILAAIIPPGA